MAQSEPIFIPSPLNAQRMSSLGHIPSVEPRKHLGVALQLVCSQSTLGSDSDAEPDMQTRMVSLVESWGELCDASTVRIVLTFSLPRENSKRTISLVMNIWADTPEDIGTDMVGSVPFLSNYANDVRYDILNELSKWCNIAKETSNMLVSKQQLHDSNSGASDGCRLISPSEVCQCCIL